MLSIKTYPIENQDLKTIRSIAQSISLSGLPDTHKTNLDLQRQAELIKLIYSTDLLDQSIGFVAKFAGIPLGYIMASPAPSPWDQKTEGLIHLFALNKPWKYFSASGAILLRQVEEEAKRRGYRALRAVINFEEKKLLQLLRTSGWTKGAVSVRKKLAPDTPPPLDKAKLQIRPAISEDLPFIKKLWVQSIYDGLGQDERQYYSSEVIERTAQQKLDLLLDSAHSILIAEMDNELVGHSIIELEVFQEFLGRSEAVLIDTFTLPQHRDLGIAVALTQANEQVTHSAGHSYINGTVYGDTPDHTLQILSKIRCSGWFPFQYTVRKFL